MICSDCIHSIFRTIRNGGDIETRAQCDLDGWLINRQLSECSKKKVAKPAEGYDFDAVPRETVVALQEKSMTATEIVKHRGWPLGKKRK